MLALTLSDFMIELKDGSIKNVGPPNKTAAAKLFDVETLEARDFGDEQVKVVFEDAEGNEVQAALPPDRATALRRDLERLEAEGRAYE